MQENQSETLLEKIIEILRFFNDALVPIVPLLMAFAVIRAIFETNKSIGNVEWLEQIMRWILGIIWITPPIVWRIVSNSGWASGQKKGRWREALQTLKNHTKNDNGESSWTSWEGAVVWFFIEFFLFVAISFWIFQFFSFYKVPSLMAQIDLLWWLPTQAVLAFIGLVIWMLSFAFILWLIYGFVLDMLVDALKSGWTEGTSPILIVVIGAVVLTLGNALLLSVGNVAMNKTLDDLEWDWVEQIMEVKDEVFSINPWR